MAVPDAHGEGPKTAGLNDEGPTPVAAALASAPGARASPPNRLAAALAVVLIAVALGPMCLQDFGGPGGYGGAPLLSADHALLQRSSSVGKRKTRAAARERAPPKDLALSVRETFLPDAAHQDGLLESFRRNWHEPGGIGVYTDGFQAQMIPALCLGVPTALVILGFAFIYKRLRVAPQAQLREPTDNWEYGLFELRECHKQECGLCLMSFCCTPIRWADTISHDNMRLPRDLGWQFWPALITWVMIVYTLAYFTACLAMLIVLVLQVHYRQQIRRGFAIKSSTCETLCLDCVLWCCCSPCVACQEARQVEQVRRAQ